MKQIYSVRSDTITDDKNQQRTVYGLNVLGAVPIPNIFTSKTEAEQFASLCNRLDLSPDHIYEVIDDIL